MSSVPKLRHLALEDGLGGVPLSQVRLTDQQRLAVVLQGASLLAHLEHGGWCLRWGWERACVAEGGILKVDSIQSGRSVDLPQVLLLDLLNRLFPTRSVHGRITGKGQPRHAARWLRGRWQQILAPVSLDRAVAETLERAPFLWQDAFAKVRQALVAQHRTDEETYLWVAGPGPNRGRFLARGSDFATLGALLRSSGARDLWEGWREDDDPVELARKHRFRQAVVCWRRRPPRKNADVLQRARCLAALGNFSQARDALKTRNTFEARLLRLQCLEELGKQGAARQLVFALAKDDMNGPQTLAVAEVAVRVLARQGLNDVSKTWVDRAFQVKGSRPELRWRAELLAAEAAWDVEDMETMSRYLVQARGALDDPELTRRWHEVRSLLAIGQGDGTAVVEHSTAVFRYRRQMSRTEAGRRWNDLAYGRVMLGDLAGAERAIRNAQRLLDRTDSSSRNTLGLSNLASIRLRRGLIDGVSEALEASTAENRRISNYRGLVGDFELGVRLELVQGRPQAALARCKDAIELISEHGVGKRQTFELFAARAHGWLGNTERSAALLARLSPEVFFELEPEERPAVWALAGDAERASREAADTPWIELWSAYAAGLHPRPAAWAELERLEGFRAARLVFDYLMVAPATVSPAWIRRAIEHLRSVEAFDFAARLERRFFSPWQAVGCYLESGRIEQSQVNELFNSAGYPEVRLVFRQGGRDILLKSGKGGEHVIDVLHENGRLVLEAPFIDPAVRTLFRLVQRDVKAAELLGSGEKSDTGEPDFIGEHTSLLEALKRLDQIAKGELPILILGESGTGKELAARRVHRASPRAVGPFEAVNCAALPEENLVQSELFGHQRGAFTGANQDRAGIFDKARGGTVFLDEIGDLPLAVQGKLLRVLQEGEFRRLGDELVRRTDVRMVAATHRDLAQMVRNRDFRQDLYYRLKGAIIELPALRERADDVLLLAELFLDRHWKNQARPAGTPPRLSREASRRLLSHSWPGNVRELKQTMERAVMYADGPTIRAEDLGIEGEEAVEKGDYHQQLEHFKRQLIGDALDKSQGNRAAAARRLGLTRQALSYLVRQMDLG